MTYVLGKPETLPGFDLYAEHIRQASFHYADDSGGEWGMGAARVAKAASVANENGWHFWQMEQAHKHVAPLVTFSQFMEAVLSGLRKGENA